MNILQMIFWVFLVVSPVLAQAEERDSGRVLPQDKAGNFILYVSNQSFTIDPVDITIYVDGKLAVQEKFYVKNQHNWISYHFSLAEGSHTIEARTSKGEAQLKQVFNITKKNWAVLDYWYNPKEGSIKSFSFHIQDRQIYFM